jgi:hypothetical protein
VRLKGKNALVHGEHHEPGGCYGRSHDKGQTLVQGPNGCRSEMSLLRWGGLLGSQKVRTTPITNEAEETFFL